MTYTPKPGDRVTSPLLVGEWEVVGGPLNYQITVRSARALATVDLAAGHLTLVAPPLPTEPAVGSVVRAHGRLWHKKADYWRTSLGDVPKKWPALATAPDLSPVVAVDEVAEWLDGYGETPDCIDDFRAEFGGWDK